MTSSNIPDFPTQPFDGTNLTDEEVIALTKQQLLWVDLNDKQWIALTNYQSEHPLPPKPPSEVRPQFLPEPEEIEEVKDFFRWVDDMHALVRRPGGISWVEIQLMASSMGKWMDWATRADIDIRYRYRIDAPMSPHPTVPDHIPDDWKDQP